MNSDVYGQALYDYYNNVFESPLVLNNNYGEPEEMPVQVFFRKEDDLSELEQYALHLCKGKILDIGAGAGVHSLILQQEFESVTALEASGIACDIMKSRGVKNICNQDIFQFAGRGFDTLLMLMNGTGISGTISNFQNLLKKLKPMLSEGGQIIIDSSDISYLYEGDMPADKYFGEVSYQYSYKNEQGAWFSWLYLDPRSLIEISKKAGFDAQIVYQGDEDQYLAILKVFS